jgi:hypothetical protein
LGRVPAESQVPSPPQDPEGLRAWADQHGVSARLDDVFIGDDAPVGTFLPARNGEVLTYRQILLDRATSRVGRRRFDDTEDTARWYLHRMATLAAARHDANAWLDQHGREPEDEVLAAFAVKLRAALRQLTAARQTSARPAGTYEPAPVRVVRAPVPTLRYQEWRLVGPRQAGPGGIEEVALILLGWNDGPLRWARYRGERSLEAEVPAAIQESALEAMIDLMRDPRQAEVHQELAELLRLPAWQFALGTLDETLSRLDADAEVKAVAAAAERIAFRVLVVGDGALTIYPSLQKRGRNGQFSRGARVQWYQLPERRDLTPAERRACQAHDDRFARRSAAWGGPMSPAQVFGVLTRRCFWIAAAAVTRRRTARVSTSARAACCCGSYRRPTAAWRRSSSSWVSRCFPARWPARCATIAT